MDRGQKELCRKTAAKLLAAQQTLIFPIEPHLLQINAPVYFDSVQSYCYTAGLPITAFCCEQVIRDGCTIFSDDRSFYLVLYNEWNSSPARRRFTLAHELGHILLSHGDDSDQSETLANRFASQLLVPRVCLSYLRQANSNLAISQISQFFGVSQKAAKLALQDTESPAISMEESRFLHKCTRQMDFFLNSCLEPIVSC